LLFYKRAGVPRGKAAAQRPRRHLRFESGARREFRRRRGGLSSTGDSRRAAVSGDGRLAAGNSLSIIEDPA